MRSGADVRLGENLNVIGNQTLDESMHLRQNANGRSPLIEFGPARTAETDKIGRKYRRGPDGGQSPTGGSRLRAEAIAATLTSRHAELVALCEMTVRASDEASTAIRVIAWLFILDGDFEGIPSNWIVRRCFAGGCG